jgi:hypothetical protein
MKYSLRLISMVISGTYFTYRSLPEQSKNELLEVANNPDGWGKSIEIALDISKISAEHFKETSSTLANLLIGRKISKSDKLKAREDLATLSIIVPPLRVFMIPGSHILLGILANVTPWRLIPDEWIPINALKKIREGKPKKELEKESRIMTKLLRRNKN